MAIGQPVQPADMAFMKEHNMPELKVAIVGCGGYASVHGQRCHDHAEANVVALCDISDDAMNGFAQRIWEDASLRPPCFTDRKTMYRASQPDAVFIATPHTLHFEHCMEALDQDCHVFVEKPMVTSTEQAYQLKEKVDASGKVLVIGYNTPCTPEFEYLRQKIRNKAFGRLELISGHLTQDWKEPMSGTWRQNPDLSGGGQAYDSGAHLLNSICWTVESNIDLVHALVDNQGTAVDINSALNIRFENGVFASVVIGGNCKSTSDGYLHYLFERGRIVVDGWAGTWIEVYDENERVKYPHIAGKAYFPDDNFIDAVFGRAEPQTTPYNGIVHSQLMDAIYASATSGQPAKPRHSA